MHEYCEKLQIHFNYIINNQDVLFLLSQTNKYFKKVTNLIYNNLLILSFFAKQGERQTSGGHTDIPTRLAPRETSIRCQLLILSRINPIL